MKACKINTSGGKFHGWMIFCPGCKFAHVFDSRWTFNGDQDKPTFKPSYLSYGTENDPRQPRCHSFVTDGFIKFLSDCTHDLAGQTVELPDEFE
jgi:hypothetical protein